jgi:Winged helix-turn-helix DNA-binding
MARKKMDRLRLDMSTEDIKDGIFVYCSKKQHSSFSGEGYMVASQPRANMLAKSGLGLTDHRVLWLLIANLDMDNLIAINQSELAAEMNIQKQNFSRSIKKLIAEGIIIEGAKLGQHKSYRLNAYYGWKGTTENHNKALESDPIPTPLSDRMKQSGIEAVIDGGKD